VSLSRSGLTPAASLHQMARGKTVAELADSSIHPSISGVYRQFEKYNTTLNGDLGRDKMWDLVADLEKTCPGVRIAFQRANAADDKDMGIAILTPLMSRVHAHVPQAAEILFVDTTSHVDTMNTSVTIMLTWTSSGALPLGVLLTDSQTDRAYRQGKEPAR